ncbi:hypothetical protein D0Z07_3398 [Hyphodiscus hymeniophilus]|uniref:Cyclase n=1 Tax=Hyphodiscus hymeniophilus TaxID=353542 RepID=A0A9P6VKW8_9HELO|nr:hypothetical protein D0Z07_3398 [Hyphodiscus hymeniophilus]
MPLPTPPFDALPLQKDGPRGNAWGLFGAKDELGMLNRLTPENTLTATKEVVHGIRVCTDWTLNLPKAPCFNRRQFEHKITHKYPRTVNDDNVHLNTQSSTQWDGFRHFGYQDHEVYFNGCKQEDIHNSLRNGTHVWVENGGIVGRGVLLDYASWAASQGIKTEALSTWSIPVSDLKKVAESQNVTFHPNDILFVRSGYINALSSLPDNEAAVYASEPSGMPAIGVESCEETLKWIWENQFTAVAGDMIAFEAIPFQSEKFSLHEWLLAGWGLPIGELFHLEALAAECRKLGKWSFLFSSVPLNVPGGVASPPNGVAIL